MDRRTFLATVVGSASVALAGCTVGGGRTPSGDFDVGMGGSAFEPREVTARVGEPVRWQNTNSRSHTVTAYESQLPPGAAYFASGGYETETAARDAFYGSFGGALTTDDTFEHTFEVAGEYPYFCIPHERGGMLGRVVVEG